MAQPPDIGQLARQGVAVVVATADAALRPAVTRGWGPVLSEDGARLSLCVDAPEGSDTLANLRTGSALAVTLSRPTSYVTVQLKGSVAAVGAPGPDDLEAAERHADAFVAETGAVGLPEAIARAIVGSALVAVAIHVAERYDQTPGPGAGRAL
jgi:hypothetical protein